MKNPKRTIPSKGLRPTVIILIAITALGVLLLKTVRVDHPPSPDDTTLPGTRQPSPQAPADIAPSRDITPNPQSAVEPPPNAPTEAEPSSPATTCGTLAEEMQLFLDHLEKQDYIKAYSLPEPIQTSLAAIFTKILDTPPITAHETADLTTILKNVAHFCRILSPKELSLLKDILTHEQADLEQRLSLFYRWSTSEKNCQDTAASKIHLPLAKTYEYALFFLNTLGGQSYLARRDLPLRVLTKYYCVLIVDQVAGRTPPPDTLNLDYHLENTIHEIASSDFLEHQDRYLDTLRTIQARRRADRPK